MTASSYCLARSDKRIKMKTRRAENTYLLQGCQVSPPEAPLASTPPSFTSRRELEALFLDQPSARGNHIGVVLDPGVLAHLGQSGLHAEGGAVRAV